MNIARFRKKLNLTQDAFARYIGVHPLTVSRWERGAAKPSKPVLLLLVLVAAILKHPDEIGKEAMRVAQKRAWRKR